MRRSQGMRFVSSCCVKLLTLGNPAFCSFYVKKLMEKGTRESYWDLETFDMLEANAKLRAGKHGISA